MIIKTLEEFRSRHGIWPSIGGYFGSAAFLNSLAEIAQQGWTAETVVELSSEETSRILRIYGFFPGIWDIPELSGKRHIQYNESYMHMRILFEKAHDAAMLKLILA